jgi:hypothetical protein
LINSQYFCMKASERVQRKIYYAQVSSCVKQLLLWNLHCLENKNYIRSLGRFSCEARAITCFCVHFVFQVQQKGAVLWDLFQNSKSMHFFLQAGAVSCAFKIPSEQWLKTKSRERRGWCPKRITKTQKIRFVDAELLANLYSWKNICVILYVVIKTQNK